MAVGLTGKLWSMSDLASIIDDAQSRPKSAGRTRGESQHEVGGRNRSILSGWTTERF
jgi:hypothetical protein